MHKVLGPQDPPERFLFSEDPAARRSSRLQPDKRSISRSGRGGQGQQLAARGEPQEPLGKGSELVQCGSGNWAAKVSWCRFSIVNVSPIRSSRHPCWIRSSFDAMRRDPVHVSFATDLSRGGKQDHESLHTKLADEFGEACDVVQALSEHRLQLRTVQAEGQEVHAYAEAASAAFSLVGQTLSTARTHCSPRSRAARPISSVASDPALLEASRQPNPLRTPFELLLPEHT